MKEQSLQQIWKERLYIRRDLKTTAGDRFVVVSPGEHNSGDGPDFKGAHIIFDDGMMLFGDVEIHIDEHAWYEHNHHLDPAYNSVILHVVLNQSGNRIFTSDGYRPATLIASGYPGIIKDYAPRKNEWPCSAHIHHISDTAIQSQFRKASREYFESKVSALMKYYSPRLTLEKAWKQLLVLAFADGLGISRNREPMQKLAARLLEEPALSDRDELYNRALRLSGLEGAEQLFMKRREWDLSGSRPHNRPRKRIEQLCAFCVNISKIPFGSFRRNPNRIWKKLTGTENRRNELLFYIVYLPALHLLGSLLFDKRLRQLSCKLWAEHRYAPETYLREKFINAGFSAEITPNHLGLVHQLKRYCDARRCDECEIFRRTCEAG